MSSFSHLQWGRTAEATVPHQEACVSRRAEHALGQRPQSIRSLRLVHLVQHAAHQNGACHKAKAPIQPPQHHAQQGHFRRREPRRQRHPTDSPVQPPKDGRGQCEHVPEHEHEHRLKPKPQQPRIPQPCGPRLHHIGRRCAREGQSGGHERQHHCNGKRARKPALECPRVSVQSPFDGRGRTVVGHGCGCQNGKSSSPAGADGMGGTAGMGAALTASGAPGAGAAPDASARSTRHAFKST